MSKIHWGKFGQHFPLVLKQKLQESTHVNSFFGGGGGKLSQNHFLVAFQTSSRRTNCLVAFQTCGTATLKANSQMQNPSRPKVKRPWLGEFHRGGVLIRIRANRDGFGPPALLVYCQEDVLCLKKRWVDLIVYVLQLWVQNVACVMI